MSEPHSINRQLLGSGGLALSDEEYARAVAALGASLTTWSSRSGESHPSIRWSAHTFLLALRNIGASTTREQLIPHGDAWQPQFRSRSDGRIAIDSIVPAGDRLDLGDVAQVLAHPAVDATSVFVESVNSDNDIRWQWPMRVAAMPDDYEALGLAALRKEWPASELASPAALGRDRSRAELFVIRGALRGALARILVLPHRARAAFVLLVAPCDGRWRELRPRVHALLAEMQAAGLAIVSPEIPIVRALNDSIRELSHDVPFDAALAPILRPRRSLLILDRDLIAATALPAAARRLGQRLKRLPPDAKLALPRETPGRLGLEWKRTDDPAALGAELESRADSHALPFERESTGGAGISEIGHAEREAERDAAQHEPPRYLQGNLFESTEQGETVETRGLVVGHRYALDLFIAPPGAGAIQATRTFAPDLPWDDDEPLTLQVLFTEPRQWREPVRGTLRLRRTGTSDTCRFVFAPTADGDFAGRVVLYYHGRILQTALLETCVVRDLAALTARDPRPIALRVEAEVRRSLRTVDERRRFDACVVCNHTTTRQAAITAAGADGAYIASLGNVASAVARIGELLAEVAHDTKTYSKGLLKAGNAELLCKLAFEGNALHRALVVDYIEQSSSAAELGAAEYMQIVTAEPNAIVPLEFVYEYPPPAEGAPVCPNALAALAAGKCPGTCHPTDSPAPHVCPMGFWGLSRVIERHMHVPALVCGAKVLGRRGEPIAGRDTLSLSGATLLAASRQVPAAKRAALEKSLRKIRPGAVQTASDWLEWKREVAAAKPIVLVALPHADGTGANITLEIGGQALSSRYINQSYVHPADAPPPLALLLGCDMARAADPAAYLSHVEVFRQADAALVLGTIATVFGADAAEMAGRLLDRLASSSKNGPACFGEALRDAKRAAVADSDMIALCLVAFGDADWKLVAE